MKKFFKEFKTFVTRGNVLDMAVGIIVGGAFTAIINSLVNNILKPLLAMIPGMNSDGLGALQVVLRRVETDGQLDITKSVIIDFGAVISAVITFLLTALVLFIIIKAMNSVRDNGKKFIESKKKKKAEETTAVEEPVVEVVEEQVKDEETDVELLKQIRDLLKEQQDKK